MLSRLSAALILALAMLQDRIALACIGDCEERGVVSVTEIITGVSIALGETDPEACTRMDADGDGMVAVNEIVAAVGNALNGCPLVVDQRWEGPVGFCDRPSITYQIKASQPLAQEFVPRLPLLGAVEAYIQQANLPRSDTLTATVLAGSLDGPVLGSATVAVPENPEPFFWQRFSFDAPLRVQTGNVYVLHLEATNATHMWLSDQGLPPCDPLHYEPGRSIIFGRLRDDDLYFRSLAVGD